MAPRRKRDTRMDAALDAMTPYGFPNKLVRRTVDQLLKVYGGTDGWVFIEESAYTLLIETLLENQQHQPTAEDEAQLQIGLKEDSPGNGHNEASPAGCSNRALVPCSNTEISYDALPTNQAVHTVSAASETGNQLPITAVDAVSTASETGTQLPIMAIDTVSADNESGNQVPINVVGTVSADSESDCQPARNLLFGEIHGTTLAYSTPRTKSPQTEKRLCHQRRRPCHGWISDDDDDNDDEEELIELAPAPLSKVSSMVISDEVS